MFFGNRPQENVPSRLQTGAWSATKACYWIIYGCQSNNRWQICLIPQIVQLTMVMCFHCSLLFFRSVLRFVPVTRLSLFLFFKVSCLESCGFVLELVFASIGGVCVCVCVSCHAEDSCGHEMFYAWAALVGESWHFLYLYTHGPCCPFALVFFKFPAFNVCDGWMLFGLVGLTGAIGQFS